jgi:hypothetical protein
MNVLNNFARWVGELSPSCKEATRLQSLALDRPLRPLESIGLRFHLLFCKWCRAYGKQIRFLRSAAQERASENEPLSSPPALSPEARERIKRNLRSGTQ